MKINDPIFGELMYEYGWTRGMELEFVRQRNTITLMVAGEEDSEVGET